MPSEGRATWRVYLSLPALCRAAAILVFLAGMALTYLDAQAMADRQVTLNSPVPAPQPMERVRPDGSLAQEVVMLARMPLAEPLEVALRHGLRRETYLVFPLSPAGAEAETGATGFAVLPAIAAQTLAQLRPDAQGLYSLHGLVGVPERVVAPARRALEAAGLPVPPTALALSLFSGPRELSLSREIRNEWRGVAFWMTACLLVAAWILQTEQRRVEAVRKRVRLERRPRRARAAQPAPEPVTAKARARFVPLAEVQDAPKPPARFGGRR
jgi:hypothetical protein